MKALLAALLIPALLLLPKPARADAIPAQAAYLLEANSGRVIAAQNENARLPMASTTKIMTALLAIESGRMNETVTVPQEAVGTEGSSMYLKAGEKLPLRDLVYGLMLRSGNDAAVAIACALDGGIDAFVERMNARAADLGLLDTHFTNPNGLHDPSHYTSARDLCLLAAAALENPVFAEIVRTRYRETGGDTPRTLKNKNRLLWEYEGGELAIDVDRTAMTEQPYYNEEGILKTKLSMSSLQQRLFRTTNIDASVGETYNVFSPPLRDVSIINGLNEILKHIEDVTGLSRGTLSDTNLDAKTATEIISSKQRSYSANRDIQKALQNALEDVVYIMNVYCTLYNITSEGDYAVSFDWDDSLITSIDEKLSRKIQLMSYGLQSKVDFLMWYRGMTKAQAKAYLSEIEEENKQAMENSVMNDLGN